MAAAPEPPGPDGYGQMVRLKQKGREVHIVFIVGNDAQAEVLHDAIAAQMAKGSITLNWDVPPAEAPPRRKATTSA